MSSKQEQEKQRRFEHDVALAKINENQSHSVLYHAMFTPNAYPGVSVALVLANAAAVAGLIGYLDHTHRRKS